MLEVKHISKKYGNRTILKDVTFTINAGEKVALVGRNGCGKTTLMQILSGAIKPGGGSIRFFNNDPLKKRRLFKEFCGYVPQDIPLLPELTVKDNLKFFNVDKCPNYQYILDRFELKDIMKMEVRKLSGGMKKRLSIACAIATWPPILLMDEPASALDLYYKTEIRKWLSEYNDLNGIILISTHEEAEILSCDRCLFLKDGCIRDIPGGDDMLDRVMELLNG